MSTPKINEVIDTLNKNCGVDIDEDQAKKYIASYEKSIEEKKDGEELNDDEAEAVAGGVDYYEDDDGTLDSLSRFVLNTCQMTGLGSANHKYYRVPGRNVYSCRYCHMCITEEMLRYVKYGAED